MPILSHPNQPRCEAHNLDAYSSFRIRDYRLLVTAAFLSSFGLQMLSAAVSWDLYIQTRSAIVLGNVGFVQVAPGLLIFSFHSVATIYACLFLTAMARAFQWPARLGLLPLIVPIETLSKAITWNSSVQEVASVSGPAVAGILLATVGSRFVYILQVVFASLTLICYLALRHRAVPMLERQPRDLKSFLDGVRFVWRNKLILPAISLDLFGVLFGGATRFSRSMPSTFCTPESWGWDGSTQRLPRERY